MERGRSEKEKPKPRLSVIAVIVGVVVVIGVFGSFPRGSVFRVVREVGPKTFMDHVGGSGP
eukprot:2015960-Heterocapsa_arctica.AAC.1